MPFQKQNFVTLKGEVSEIIKTLLQLLHADDIVTCHFMANWRQKMESEKSSSFVQKS